MAPLRIGILTVSDSCSQGKNVDTSGENLAYTLAKMYPGSSITRECVPDERSDIVQTLTHWCDRDLFHLVLTTGGTGFGPRDVTPEATTEIIERPAPGLVHRMMSKSLEVTPLAMLSRLTAGTRGNTLIVNFPGSKKASAECFMFIAPGLTHALDLINDEVRQI